MKIKPKPSELALPSHPAFCLVFFAPPASHWPWSSSSCMHKLPLRPMSGGAALLQNGRPAFTLLNNMLNSPRGVSSSHGVLENSTDDDCASQVLPGTDGETATQGLDNLGARCAEYYKQGRRFCPMLKSVWHPLMLRPVSTWVMLQHNCRTAKS